ncbi:MAG: prepilin-type N-terminal cleavage/methylation domain-containing protein [Desulfobacterales bacterium]|nr:prepilin-type N-terminal cleavage/methylation domain-containing protein [Desulfobacterales bacterium]
MLQKLVNKNSKGFTLIELMIVVAIIGILAAIAIPNFRNYQMKAKTAESKTNLGAIRGCEETYRADYDVFLNCAANPAAGVPGAAKAAFDTAPAAGTFPGMGFAPSGEVYYQYAVAGATADVFTATATGDLDGDGATAVYTQIQTGALTGPVPPGVW